MSERSARSTWLCRFLFWLLLILSALLIALVVLCPVVDDGIARPESWRRFVTVFARDGTVRKTAIACAIGLTVTAYVFFREGQPPRPSARKNPSAPAPPSGIAGV